MRYRKLDANGDYTFGHQQQDFLIDSPEAVAQAVYTRLKLATGEWFLNTSLGTPYQEQILGARHQDSYDQAMKERITDTTGVTNLTSYYSNVDPDTYALTVIATIDTIYGTTQVTFTG